MKPDAFIARPLRLVPFLAAAAIAAGCAHARVEAPPPRVWLLGDVHDNATGHAARIALLRAEIAQGWRPAIAMEQFDTGEQTALDAAMRECADAACVIARAAPGKPGWDWQHYAPVITLALEYRLPVLAANLARDEARKVVKDGFGAALPENLIARYALEALPDTLASAQEREVRDSHCGALPEPLLAPMARAQIARDVVMADVVRDRLLRHPTEGIMLLAGNGHVRRDIGVPYWLARDGIGVRAVGWVESAAAGQFDTAHVVEPAGRDDPCAGFKAPAGK